MELVGRRTIRCKHSLTQLMAEEPLFVGQTNIQRRCETTEGTRHPERERTRWEVGPRREAESSAGRYSASPAALTAETSACKLLWLTDLWTKKCFIHYQKVSCLWKEGSYIVAYYTYYRSGWYVNTVLFTWRKICWNFCEVEWGVEHQFEDSAADSRHHCSFLCCLPSCDFCFFLLFMDFAPSTLFIFKGIGKVNKDSSFLCNARLFSS